MIERDRNSNKDRSRGFTREQNQTVMKKGKLKNCIREREKERNRFVKSRDKQRREETNHNFHFKLKPILLNQARQLQLTTSYPLFYSFLPSSSLLTTFPHPYLNCGLEEYNSDMKERERERTYEKSGIANSR